jgi:hypothetical protein
VFICSKCSVYGYVQSGAVFDLGGIVKCCVLRSFSSGGFLQDSVLEGTAFDDEYDLFVAA